jgi:hypothetical protein
MRIQIIICVFLLIAGCSRELDYKISDFDKKLVINGFMCPDSFFCVNVRKTTSILSNEVSIIENADVYLYKNGLFLEHLEYSYQGNYISSIYRPIPGNEYSITVKAQGFNDVSAKDTVPQTVYISQGSRTSGNTFDEYGDPHIDYEILFLDLFERNYYELFFIIQGFPNEYTSKYWVDFMCDPVIPDPVLKADSELDLHPFTYIFTDNLFNGQQYQLKIKFISAANGGEFLNPFAPTPRDQYAILRNTSYAYYNYKKYWLRHSYNKQVGNKAEVPFFMPLIGDPVAMYSNVEGGYGVFAAYNQSYYKFEKNRK